MQCSIRHLQLAFVAFAILFAAAVGHAKPLEKQRHVLSNGAVLLISEQPNVPMVVVNVLIDAGSRRDPAGKEGLANLTADLLTEGTKTRSAIDISEAVDTLGASLSSSAGVDTANVGMTALSKDLETGFELLADVLLNPSFPNVEVARRREAVLASLKAKQDDPGHVASLAFTEYVFANEPYGHLSSGTPAGLANIDRNDIVEFYRDNYRSKRAIITVVGDVAAPEIVALLEKSLARWDGRAEDPFVYPDKPEPEPTAIRIDRPLTQANIVLGHHGIARSNPDYYAVEVMNFILGGGGFGSRLLDRIRTAGGLAYSVASGFTTPKSPGSFRVVLQTKNESAAEAITLACKEVERIRREPVSDDELSDAKLYLTGSFPMQLDSNAEIASFLTEIEFFELGLDYAETYLAKIDAVTKDDVLRVAKKYLHPEKLSLVVVANLEQSKVAAVPPCQPAAAAE